MIWKTIITMRSQQYNDVLQINYHLGLMLLLDDAPRDFTTTSMRANVKSVEPAQCAHVHSYDSSSSRVHAHTPWGRELGWSSKCGSRPAPGDQAHQRDVGAMHPGSLTSAALPRRGADCCPRITHMRVLAYLLNIPDVHGEGLVEFPILTPRIRMDWWGRTTVA